MKKRNIIDVVAVILGAFVFTAYISYFIKLLIWPEGAFPLCVCITVMTLSAVPVIFHSKLAALIPGKVFTALKCTYLFAAAFYTLTFVLLTVYIYSTVGAEVRSEDVTDDTVIIVYGAGLKEDGVPDRALQKRLDKALALAGENSPYIIVSGAQGYGEPCTEAFAMREYLLAKGYDGDKVIMEENAKDTKENVRYCFEIIKEMGLDGATAVSVSNKFHVPRIRLLCTLNGLETEVAAADDPDGGIAFASLVREYMSYVKLFITGHN